MAQENALELRKRSKTSEISRLILTLTNRGTEGEDEEEVAAAAHSL